MSFYNRMSCPSKQAHSQRFTAKDYVSNFASLDGLMSKRDEVKNPLYKKKGVGK
jgi:hypothetical protein